MEDVTHNTENALQQSVVIRNVLEDLQNHLEKSKQLTQSFDKGEALWRGGLETGLEIAIELLEDALKKEEQKLNEPQKPQLNIAIVSGNFYWVKPFNNSEFEPAKARLDYRDKICFAFTDGSTMSIDAVWEVEPLNYR